MTSRSAAGTPRPVVEPGTCDLAFGPNVDGRCEWCGVSLPVGRPGPWCSAGCEAAFVDAHVWPRARAAALRRTARRCGTCGGRDRVQVHHLVPVESYEPGCRHHGDGLRVLCHAHHREAHRALRSEAPYQLALLAA